MYDETSLLSATVLLHLDSPDSTPASISSGATNATPKVVILPMARTAWLLDQQHGFLTLPSYGAVTPSTII
jgi:hypothetical protein